MTQPNDTLPDFRPTPEEALLAEEQQRLAEEQPQAKAPRAAPVGTSTYSFTFAYPYGNRTQTVPIEAELSAAEALEFHIKLKLVFPFIRSRSRTRTRKSTRVEVALLVDRLRYPDAAALARRHRVPAAFIEKLWTAFEGYQDAAMQQPEMLAYLMRDPLVKNRLKRLERMRSVPPSDGPHST